MTLSPKLLAGAAFLVAGGLSAVAAQTIVRTVEGRSVEAVADRLSTGGFVWAEVLGDGLQVVIEGEAPTESARFEAISAAAQVVDGARVIDNMRVADAADIAPPAFALEVLRNDAGVSLIGLVPATTDRDEILEDFADATEGQPVSDLLQTADYPVPEGWEPALGYALDALELLPRAKVSVAAGRVSIEAVADSPEAQRRLESELAAMAPDGVRLALAVSAPRPVISPFTVRVRLEEGRLAFDACSADTEEARDAILGAAAAAGAEGQVACRLGLGTPTPEWGPAVAAGISALAELGGGRLTFSDADVSLVALPGTEAALFDRVTGELDRALPEPFALEAERPLPPSATDPDRGPPEFAVLLSEDGDVRLQGPIEDERMAGLVRAFAQARFGAADVALATRTGGGLPAGWSMRVLAGIEALSRLHDGRVTVTPETIVVSGRTGRADARDEIAARAIETLGPQASLEIEVAYDEALDPLAALPTPEECLAKIAAVTDAAKITFDPGSATISAEGEPVIEAIAEILRSCPDLRLRISGYTDSQGREESNLRLSQDRAEAVLSALRAERVPVAGFEAQGFGEADPIASNESEAGREANRRIEFTLLGLGPVPPAGPAPATAPGEGTEEAGAEAGADSGADAEASEPLPEPLIDQPDSPPERPEEVEEEGTEILAELAPDTGEEAGEEAQEDAEAAADAPEAAGDAPAGEPEPVSPEAALAGVEAPPAAPETQGPPPPPAGEEPAPEAAARPVAPSAAEADPAPDTPAPSEPATLRAGEEDAPETPAEAAAESAAGEAGAQGLAPAAGRAEEGPEAEGAPDGDVDGEPDSGSDGD